LRLFVAVDIDEATREQLRVARATLEQWLERVRLPPRMTWVKPEVAHVTVRFIGEMTESAVRPIQDALAGVVIAPFEVTWQIAGTFGGTKHPKVVWVAPSAGVAAFVELAERVNAALDPVIGPPDERRFRPHLTISRVREPGRGVDWAEAIAALRFVPSPMLVDHVTLYQSRLSPKGPTYTALSSHG
jgi:2'-5' RNA ligase